MDSERVKVKGYNYCMDIKLLCPKPLSLNMQDSNH